jgi:O-methyltransferase
MPRASAEVECLPYDAPMSTPDPASPARVGTARPPLPPLDDRMRKYMRARTLRRWVSDGLSASVRLAYRGRLDPGGHSIIIPESSLSPWRSDEQFRATMRQIEGFSLVDEMRLYELWQLAGQLASVEGDILEVGVWRGGSGCLLGQRSATSGSATTVFLCDTFAGVVNAGEEDPIYVGGEHSDTSPELVKSLAAYMGLSNSEVLVGMFPEETGAVIADRRFKLCHLDVDVYGSTRAAAEWAWPRLVVGGVIVFDDYGGDGMDGVQQAVHEVAAELPGVLIHNLNGHALLIKVGDDAGRTPSA